MIAGVAAWVAARYRCGWFGPSHTGGFPAPAAGAGWACSGALIAALAGSVLLPAGDRMSAAGLAFAAYAGIVYWTYRSDA